MIAVALSRKVALAKNKGLDVSVTFQGLRDFHLARSFDGLGVAVLV